MNKLRYWTYLDKIIVSFFLSQLKSLLIYFKQLMNLSRIEVLLMLCLFLGIFLRVGNMHSDHYLSDEIRHIRQAVGVFSSFSEYKHESNSTFGILLMIPVAIAIILAKSLHWFSVVQLFRVEGLSMKSAPYLIGMGRFFEIALFAATLYSIFKIGDRFFNARVGILSAFLLAISPIYIETSSFLLPQNAAILFLAILIYFSLSWLQDSNLKESLLMGAAWGLFCAFSFHGLYLVPFALIFAFFRTIKGGSLFLLGLLGAYFLATLHLNINIPLRLDDIAKEVLSRREYFMDVSRIEKIKVIGSNIGWGLLIFFALSLFCLILNKNKKPYLLFCFAFAGIYMLLFNSFFYRAPEDLVLVLIPMILLACYLLEWGFKKLSPIVAWILFALLVSPSILASPLFSKKPACFENRRHPLSEIWNSFNPGNWNSDYLFNYSLCGIFSPEYFLKREQEAYSPKFVEDSLKNELRTLTFIAQKSDLKSVIFIVNNQDKLSSSMLLELYDDKNVLLSECKKEIPGLSGWMDIEFVFNQKLTPGNVFVLKLTKTKGDIKLLKTDRNIFRESISDLQDMEPTVRILGKGGDYLLKINYSH